MQPPVAERPPAGPSTPRRRGHRLWVEAVTRKWPITAAFSLLLLCLWQWAALVPTAPAYLIGPVQIVAAMIADFGRLALFSGFSLARVLVGFAIGAFAGAVVGLINGTNRAAREFGDPVVSMTYPIPKVAIFPAIAVILGYTDVSRTFIIALAAFYPTYFSAYSGARSIDKNLLFLAQNAALTKTQTFFSVTVPATLPRIFTGLRISLAVSFVLLYVAEALGGSGAGLGFRIVLVAQTDQYALLYAAIACFALLGILGDRALLALGRRLTRGQELGEVGDAR